MQDDRSWKVMGSDPGAEKGFFMLNIGWSLFVADVPKIRIEIFLKIIKIRFPFCRLEQFGGICDCQSTRDTFLYAASVDSRGLDATVEIIADVVLRPEMSEEEVDIARYAVRSVTLTCLGRLFSHWSKTFPENERVCDELDPQSNEWITSL